ncbi:uncharacterized protein Pyn_36987 [Prunus yedoensis var. nudiflora]|uniref:Uncharacterized protein n=1 Tax=Prunus yedoensis var. nudiflora TaxID=2094558 RepID=A0A314XGZ7_PRUYE|nr:uncharacterized protein Pyn_36987 [Prunus yedoensis var. nudiflora]
MDNVSSLECLKFDSESEVLAKDDGVKNLFSPAMIPLNCDMLIIGECKYCLHVGDHISQLCPYKYDAPKNATIGESCMVVFSICCCLLRDSCCADCDLSIGCAVLKDCPICGKQGERWPSTCSKREGKHIPSGFTCDFDTGFFLPTNVH